MIVLTQEQKEVVEEQGYMVVQFKKWWNDIEDTVKSFSICAIETWRKIVNFLEYMAYKAKDILIGMGEIEPLIRLGVLLKKPEIVHRNIQQYEFIKKLGNMKQIFVSKQVIYHRCRDRC